MSGRDKRKMGGCQLMALVVAEGVAVIAAIVAITGTFWLGAWGPVFFSTCRVSAFSGRVSRALPLPASPRLATRRPERHRERPRASRRLQRRAVARVLRRTRDPRRGRRGRSMDMLQVHVVGGAVAFRARTRLVRAHWAPKGAFSFASISKNSGCPPHRHVTSPRPGSGEGERRSRILQAKDPTPPRRARRYEHTGGVLGLAKPQTHHGSSRCFGLPRRSTAIHSAVISNGR